MFYRKVEDGYNVLLKSLYYNGNKKVLEKSLNTIFMKRKDGRYVGGYSKTSNEFDFLSFSLDSFYDLLQCSEVSKGVFILDLNKKVSLETLNNFFKNSLEKSIEDKNFFSYNSHKYSFPYQNLLSRYQKELDQSSVQIGFFLDNSDSYYLFLFPMKKENLVKKAVFNIGFEYQKITIKESSEEIYNNYTVVEPTNYANCKKTKSL
jgi:hypothetical protein